MAVLRNLVILLAAALVMPAALAQSLVLGTKLELNTLDPHFFNAFPTGSSHAMIYDPLVYVAPDQQLKPALATSWRVIDDTTWEFKLRHGVKFHDGSDFSADDVIATFERVPNVPNSPNSFAQFVRGISSVTTQGDDTLIIKTKAPNPKLAFEMSRVLIVPARIAKSATTADFNSGKAAIGTGAYKVVEWVNGDRLVLARNDAYWGPKEPWAEVTEKVIAKDPTRVAALLAGEVDAIDLPPTADLARIRADPRFRLTNGAAGLVHYIALDSARDVSPHVTAKDGKPLTANPLKDPRVRKALSLAINRQLIADKLMEGSAQPASQLLPATYPGTSQKLKPDPFDLPKAQALLKEAGWGEGFRIVLATTNDRYPNDAAVAQAIGQMWSRLGLKVEIEAVPGSIFFGRASKQEFSAFAAQYGSEEAGAGIRALLMTPDASTGAGTANRTRYSNAKVDALAREALVQMDEGKRSAWLTRAIELAMEDQAIIPVFYPIFDYASKKNLAVTHRPERRFNAGMIRPAK
ncbi:MAG TPA: ABC transporter substrate-binding protein [Casimicrobiaceae bacterium]|nr:ABC transporter substrate-binding protein [Casimicrobiaceae bacterium]